MRMMLIATAALLCMGCDEIQNILSPPPPAYDGAFLIVEADAHASADQHLDELSEQMAELLRATGIRYNGRGVSDGVVRLRLVDASHSERALAALAPITGHLTLSVQADGLIEGRLSDAYFISTADQLAQRALPILQQRLDRRIARAEPYEPGRLIVRTTEDTVPTSVRDVFSQRGRLSFHLVRDIPPDQTGAAMPSGAMLVQPYGAGGNPEIVERRALLTADRLVRVSPSTDPQTGQFVLSFELDDQGRSAFCRLTREHTGERFAILLDNQVLTAPMINEPICGGTGQISGNFTAQSANELAIMLRVRALPAPFRIIEEHDAPSAL